MFAEMSARDETSVQSVFDSVLAGEVLSHCPRPTPQAYEARISNRRDD